ncbi:MAG: hypothetical protein VR69_12970 [Peptococcaceae bacterium BRH_c4b]|nr:MAG: hypothetical protein VR69_12970 [Peptococcaceae bacterium BRH_c4b]
MVKSIDVHNHLYPVEWLEYLQKNANPRLVKTGPTSYLAYVNDVICAHIDRPGHYDPAARVEDLDKAGLDIQVLSQTIPSVELLSPEEGEVWAKRVNDSMAETCRKYPGRFYFYITLPYQDMDRAMKELERCKKEMGDYARGIMFFSNINGKPVASPEFMQLYAAAEEYQLPILVHPASPLTDEVMKKVKLPVQLFGYTLDTTMAVVTLIFSGVLEKHPNLKLIHCHLGGMAPYMLRRMDDSFKGYGKEWGYEGLPKKPSEYYKAQVYPDTCNFNKAAVTCCYQEMGADHIVLGTDYAHRVGDPEGAIGSVNALDISAEDKDAILGLNAAKIFNIK